MIKTECARCGVAYDMGRNYCVELGCGVSVKQVAELVSEKKKYPARPVDPLYSRFSSVRYRANKRGLDFDLTPEFIEKILNEPCIYCLCYDVPQLDRRDNLKGYTMNNVVPACKRCNTVKSMYLSYDEMMIVAEALGWRE
jgi:hypothetical protein